MIKIENKKECCGCNACIQICPKSCINMIEDKQGFLYPKVIEETCISCGLCEKICPIINKKNENMLESYLAYAKDDILRMRSSSGAIFSLCGEEVLNQKGVVFGAVFDPNFEVHHICIDNINDFQLLRGSKYVQSRIEETYKETETYLKEGKIVLYSGVGCQIAGLKNFLRKSYDNLYTIDVLCHGVPSPKVWRQYIKDKEKEYNSKIKNIEFRNKVNGWKNFSMILMFENDNVYSKTFRKDEFMKLFLGDICLRPSCYDCKFKELDRNSDLTIGDAWGVENYKPHMDDDKGTSIILIHTEQGRKIFNLVKDKMIYEIADVDKALSPTADSRKSVNPHSNVNKFWNKVQNKSITTKEMINIMEGGIVKKVKKVLRKVASQRN